MNDQVVFYKKLLLLVSILFFIALLVVVLNYEIDPTPIVIGDLKKTYTAQEVRNMIKKLPDYQHDSLLISNDGKIISLDGLIQSTLVQVYDVDLNLKGLKAEAKNTGMPEPFLAYKMAIKWYIAQYGDKSKQASDSLVVE